MRLEKFLDEGKYKLTFAGYHLKDNILDDITVEELQEVVYSNIPNKKINERSVKAEFESLLKTKLNDAKFVAKKIIPSLTQDLQDMVEGCDGSGKKLRKRKGKGKDKDKMDEMNEGYTSNELNRINIKADTINIKVSDYDGHSTKYLGLNDKEACVAFKKFIDQRMKNLPQY